ncbi:MAG: KUP/HAK/KT family potassium transporter, partial [Polyangiaceae bacterium]
SAVVPLTCLVLLALFAVQRRGTGGLGNVFGPVMLAWFGTIGGLGAWHVSRNPDVLAALSPRWGALYFAHHGVPGLAILGVVVLAVTGGEALYADMGHFGTRPIRLAWLGMVFPALVLCYLGQGALVLRDPGAATNPFFAMVPKGGPTYALVALATAATIIASQALITGVFSLTHQAITLGYFPRVTVTHTSRHTEGQIYVPEMNWALCIACLALVLGFRESSRLAAAYGIAVSGTMGITSFVYFVVTRRTWGWPLWKALPPLVLFLSLDLPFFGANLLKFMDGGWIPIAVGACMFVVMIDWRVGRGVLSARLAEHAPPVVEFAASLPALGVTRLPGAAVYMSSNPDYAPPVLTMMCRRVKSLREKLVLLTVITEHVPMVDPDARTTVEALGNGVTRVVVRTGFMETPHVPAILAKADLGIDLSDVPYFLGRETFVVGKGGRMGVVSEGLFSFLSRNAKSATSWFSIPPEQVVEIGMQLDL